MISTPTTVDQPAVRSQPSPQSPEGDAPLAHRVDPKPTAELGHLQLAREIYEHILSSQPGHLESLRELGHMDVEQGEYATAVERLTKVTELDPRDAESHHRLGLAYAATGDLFSAEQAHRRAAELSPQMTAAHFHLGLALKQQNKLGEATGSFQQTLRLDQNHGRAFNQLGDTLEQQGNLDHALICYQEARVKELINEAFEIGMLQIRSEIEALARTVLITQPKNIMEIGSHRGGTMYLWCNLVDNGGKRIVVDLPDGEFGGLSPDEIDLRNAKMSNWSQNLTTINTDSHEIATYEKVLEALEGEQLDFLFIDGDHSYQGVKLDFFMYRSLVRQGGLIAFHDIKDTQLHRDQNCNVARLWEELSGEKMEIRAEGEWGGIGVIQC